MASKYLGYRRKHSCVPGMKVVIRAKYSTPRDIKVTGSPARKRPSASGRPLKTYA